MKTVDLDNCFEELRAKVIVRLATRVNQSVDSRKVCLMVKTKTDKEIFAWIEKKNKWRKIFRSSFIWVKGFLLKLWRKPGA